VIADARPTNWVDLHAPALLKPYFKLARYDRPIGTWLLLLPCWLGLGLTQVNGSSGPPEWLDYLLFTIGAIAMRGAGCTWNDIVDRDYDGRVERTALRPIPAGQVSVKQAVAFGVIQSLIGFFVLIQFNAFTIVLGIASLALVAAYPFAKRYTYWPQVVLGMAFNWGVLVAWTGVRGSFEAADGSLAWAPFVFYAGAVAWTVAYDTIYAHQDKEDDALLGLKSTALRFADRTSQWLTGFFALTLALWTFAAHLAGAGLLTYLALALTAAHFAWQTMTLDQDDAANCLRRFKSNRDVGLILCAGLIGDLLWTLA